MFDIVVDEAERREGERKTGRAVEEEGSVVS